MIKTFPTTAVDPKAMFPEVVVVNEPVGISLISPPPEKKNDGGVIVEIAAVPDTKLTADAGAIVAADAIVGAAFDTNPPIAPVVV